MISTGSSAGSFYAYERDTNDTALSFLVFPSVEIDCHGVSEDERVGDSEQEKNGQELLAADSGDVLVEVFLEAKVWLQPKRGEHANAVRLKDNTCQPGVYAAKC